MSMDPWNINTNVHSIEQVVAALQQIVLAAAEKHWNAALIGDIVVNVDTTPADNEVLAYDSATTAFINQTAAEAGLSVTGHAHAHSAITGVTANQHHNESHAANHTDGTDDVQNATSGQKGLATAAQITKLDGIATGADVTGDNAPQAHKDSHDPQDGGDALDTAAASEIAGVQAAATGSSHSLARADHAHQIQHGIADDHLVTVDSADAASGEYAKFTANGLESKTFAEVKSDLGVETREHTLYIEDPVAGDSFPMSPAYVSKLSSVTRVVAVTDVGTVDFNIEERAKTTPDQAGTKIDAAEMQATVAGLDQTAGFENDSLAADTWVQVVVDAVASSPTQVWISLVRTIT